MITEVKGLVLRTTDVRETDRMLTIYTDELGLVSAMARGVRSVKSRLLSSTGQFSYSNFVLFSQGDKVWVREASLIEGFFGIRESVTGLALAGYIAEVLCHVATAEPERELLRVALNSLFAVSSGKYDIAKIKGAFEIRVASVLGFMPDVISCHRCGGRGGDFFFDIMAGLVECRDCHVESVETHTTLSHEHEGHILCILTEGAKTALGYCIYCPVEKLFSFKISDEDMRLFSRAAEQYLLNHLERTFKTLDFYKEVNG